MAFSYLDAQHSPLLRYMFSRSRVLGFWGLWVLGFWGLGVWVLGFGVYGFRDFPAAADMLGSFSQHDQILGWGLVSILLVTTARGNPKMDPETHRKP